MHETWKLQKNQGDQVIDYRDPDPRFSELESCLHKKLARGA